MGDAGSPHVAIVDYGMGNLYSVQRACAHVALDATITSLPVDIEGADGVILPGVGAFGDAMEALRNSKLDRAIVEAVAKDKPFLGICLGLQLLMSEGFEMGQHRGLGVFPGKVIRFENPRDPLGPLKVPQVGWNGLNRAPSSELRNGNPWQGTLLEDLPAGELMYFVHSYHVVPDDPSLTLSVTRYGNVDFCSSIHARNLFACQYHPEQSGPWGLGLYERFARLVRSGKVMKGADAC